MAVASAGLYASLHLAPDRQPRQYTTTLFFTGRMPFLPPNQQSQSTEGTIYIHSSVQKNLINKLTEIQDHTATLGNLVSKISLKSSN